VIALFNLHSHKRQARSRTFTLIALLLAVILVSGCDKPNTSVRDFDSGGDSAPRANVRKGIKPLAADQVAVIETADYSNIVIELYPNVAPQMVARFKQLIQEGFYDGTTFHRINAASGLIQGGDPLSQDNNPENDGTGDSPYPNVPGEFSDIPFDRGMVGAARRGASPEGSPAISEAQARDTANCQFFIVLEAARMPRLTRPPRPSWRRRGRSMDRWESHKCSGVVLVRALASAGRVLP